VKGLLLPTIAALALHVLLLSVKVDWRKEGALSPPSPIRLSLSYKAREAGEAPSPTPVEEPRKKPDHYDALPDPKPEVPKKTTVKKPSVTLPRERNVPQSVPLPSKVEAPPVRSESTRAEMETSVPSIPVSETKQAQTAGGHQPLAAIPHPAEERAYSKQALPLYLKNPPPEYPPAARRRGYEGRVVMDVLIDREGRVGNIKIFQSSGHKVLDQAAMETVRGWLFAPARRGDEAAEMWVKVPLTFRLK